MRVADGALRPARKRELGHVLQRVAVRADEMRPLLVARRQLEEADWLDPGDVQPQPRWRPRRRRAAHLLWLGHVAAAAVKLEERVVQLRRQVICLQVERTHLRARSPAGQRVKVIALGAQSARIDARDSRASARLEHVVPLALLRREAHLGDAGRAPALAEGIGRAVALHGRPPLAFLRRAPRLGALARARDVTALL
eukprot:2860613-Pleurochrysis_carterae.AAC.1